MIEKVYLHWKYTVIKFISSFSTSWKKISHLTGVFFHHVSRHLQQKKYYRDFVDT